jgi:cytochrome c
MKQIYALLAATAVLASGPVLANAELAQKKNCMACHAVDKKLVGPSFKDIAAKYASNKDAVATLTTKVIKGGAGVWGQIPMPANALSEAESKQLVTWVLSQK